MSLSWVVTVPDGWLVDVNRDEDGMVTVEITEARPRRFRRAQRMVVDVWQEPRGSEPTPPDLSDHPVIIERGKWGA